MLISDRMLTSDEDSHDKHPKQNHTMTKEDRSPSPSQWFFYNFKQHSPIFWQGKRAGETLSMTMATITKPLHGFARISDSALFLQSPSSRKSDVSLVVLCTWAAAHTKHIAKYTDTYQRLHPGASLLIIQSSVYDMAVRTEAAQRKRLGPCCDVILNEKASGGRALLHVFSNAGCRAAGQLLTALPPTIKTRHVLRRRPRQLSRAGDVPEERRGREGLRVREPAGARRRVAASAPGARGDICAGTLWRAERCHDGSGSDGRCGLAGAGYAALVCVFEDGRDGLVGRCSWPCKGGAGEGVSAS